MATGSASGLRVLQLGPLYNNHLRRWSAHATALGCQVTAAGHVRRGRRPADFRGVADAVEVSPDAVDLRRQRLWLIELIERIEPDLIQAHWLPRWGYLACAVECRPTILTPWGSDVYLAAGDERRHADRALATADRVLARSPHMRSELLARGVGAERLAEIDLGVDLDRFTPAAPHERAALRRQLGLPSGPVVLSLRAPTPLYNLPVLIRAFELVLARRPDATLVMLHGDLPLPVELAAGLGDAVRTIRAVPHARIERYIRAATVGVSIPSSDGSPSSVWEALACGLPMVLSDLPQLASRLGQNAGVELVAPGPEAVANAIVDLIGARHGSAAQAGRAWAVAHADEREQIARLGELYAATVR
jgi:glycosyltransferase involved in cell wall biosynthesis